MTLQMQLTANAQYVYADQFAPAADNLSLLYNPLTNATPPTAYPANGAQLQADLNSTSPVYNVIDLQPGAMIYADQPIQISQSVEIVGNGATLKFDQQYSYTGGSTANWPSTDPGAIFVNNPANTHLQIELEGFTIDFTGFPVWNNPTGDTPAQYDPNNPAVPPPPPAPPQPPPPSLAVINTADNTENTYQLSLVGMSITGPSAIDASSYGTLYTAAQQLGDLYAGEQDMPLVITGGSGGAFTDSGTITGCTFQGGNIDLDGGPWNVTNNTVLGAVADTYSPAAFSLTNGHDVLLEGNQVSQSASPGTLFRLVNLASGTSSDVTIEGNSFGGNGGAIGNEAKYTGTITNGVCDGCFNGTNDPEVVLAEADGAGVLFQGRPGAISSDGRLLVLPNVQTSVTGYGTNTATGAGEIVTILAGVNSSNLPDMALAGEWFSAAQQVQVTAGSDGFEDLELLMEDPLPAMPAGGYYVIEVSPGYVNTSFINNSISLVGKSSGGFVLTGDAFGTRVIGNLFVGGTVYDNESTGSAISIEAPYNVAGGSGTDAFPAGWTVLPDEGTLIEDNVIKDALGGLQIGVYHSVNYGNHTVNSTSDTGRVYDAVSVVGNIFEQDQSWLTSWKNSAYLADGNSPGESTIPPTITVGYLFSAEAPGLYGSPRFPWTVGALIDGITPIFVDPAEDVVDAQGNSAYTVASNGALSLQQEPTGQAYAGIVNGNTVESGLVPETNDNITVPKDTGTVYYPFNVNTGLPGNPDSGNQLNINDAPTTTQGIQALMFGQDNYDLVGSGTNTPASDGIQDLHIELTGLSPTATVAGVEILDNSGNEWLYPDTGTYHQIVFYRGTGGTTADIFIQPQTSHLDDTFTVELTYANESGGPIILPVQGVLFNPSLGVLPTVSQPPLNVAAVNVTSSQVPLSWAPVPGASSYVVERSPASTNPTWSVIATGATSTSYTDTSVSNATNYDYAVRAISASDTATTGTPLTATSGTFLKEDSATEGTWIGTYGSEAYDLVDSSSSLPDATITASNESTTLWSNTTTNTPALQIPGSNYRVAAAWYSATSFTVDVDVTDGQTHDLALYFLDYVGGNARSEQVTLSNASTNAVLDTEFVSSFSNGIYLQWQISGNVLITIKCLAGTNAVLSGLFVDPPSLVGMSPFSQTLQVTTGSPADVLSAQALSLGSQVEGQSLTATIALFTDNKLSTQASSFTATINWGDWMTTLGTVYGGSGSFSVVGTHTYSAFGNFAVSVQITLGSPVTASASTVSTAAVSPPSAEVTLSSYYNEVGITTTGSSTKGALGAGANESYSSTALGGSIVTWNSAALGLR